MVSVPKLWPGETFVCVGSGPSLTVGDVEFMRGRARVIAVNDAYRLVSWADVLYACDDGWWRWQYRNRPKDIEAFAGLKFSLKPESGRYAGVQVLRNTGDEGLELKPTGLRTGRNSGYQAINLAVHLGASRVILLGYDMRLGARGQKHWYGDHGSTRSPYVLFRRMFQTIVQPLKDCGVEVVNCSRQTALTCFPRVPLEQALASREVAA